MPFPAPQSSAPSTRPVSGPEARETRGSGRSASRREELNPRGRKKNTQKLPLHMSLQSPPAEGARRANAKPKSRTHQRSEHEPTQARSTPGSSKADAHVLRVLWGRTEGSWRPWERTCAAQHAPPEQHWGSDLTTEARPVPGCASKEPAPLPEARRPRQRRPRAPPPPDICLGKSWSQNGET